MTIAIERERQGREPFEIVEVDLDYCQETFGVAPCTATIDTYGAIQDISELVYNSDFVDISAQDTSPRGLFFKPDGLKAYIVGSTGQNVYQYTLSTAWDISTATYDSVSFSTAGQCTTEGDLWFKSDGLTMYVLDRGGDAIYQYTLSTAWDISTASYASKTFSTSPSVAEGLDFNADGTAAYYIDRSSDSVIEVTLSTAWDISTGSNSGNSMDVSSEHLQASGFRFNSDGTKIFTVDETLDFIYQYSLTTAYDLTTGSYDGLSFDISSQSGSTTGVALNEDDSAIYVVSWSPGIKIFQYDSPDLSLKCYNTQSTCQDTANYNQGTKTYRFCTQGARLPAGDTLIPCVVSSSLASPEINLNQSVGLKGSATIALQDFTHHDRGIDKYVDERSYNPDTQGTYFGRLKARNIYHQGRAVRVYKGFFTDPIDLLNFDKYEYFIDRFEGLNSKGQLTIIAKDPLKLAGNDRAKCPVANSGVLSADITVGAGSLVLSPTGIGDDEYPSGAFTIRIGDEVISASRVATSDTVTLVSRGTYGSTASSHSSGDVVQVCKVWVEENVVDIIEDLLTNFTTIPASYISTADWTTQKNSFLSANIFTAVISEPEGVEDLLNELVRDNLINLYWNDKTSKIILSSIIPDDINSAPDPISEDKNYILNSVNVKDEPKSRVSRVRVIFAPRDVTQISDEFDFAETYIAIDATAESDVQYGEQRIKTIMTRWFSSANRGVAIQLASRILNRYRDNPFKADFMLDPKDAVHDIGTSFTMDSRQHQAVDGSNEQQRMQVIKVQPPAKVGGNFSYKAASVLFPGRYAFIAPGGTPDYSAATTSQREQYGFIADSAGLMLDGSDGYLIL